MSQQQVNPNLVKVFMVAFATDENGAFKNVNDVANGEIIKSQGQVVGLRVIVGGSEVTFPADRIEKLIAVDPNNPLAMRFITIKKENIFQAHVEYNQYLKNRIEGISNELDKAKAIQTTFHKFINEDESSIQLKQMYQEARVK